MRQGNTQFRSLQGSGLKYAPIITRQTTPQEKVAEYMREVLS